MANGVNQSSGVARTGVDVANLNDPDLGAASFSRQGVVDRSGEFAAQATATGLAGIASAIGEAGQIALDADLGFSKASLEKELRQGVVQDFLNRRDPEFMAQQDVAFQDASTSLFALDQVRGATVLAEGPVSLADQDPAYSAVLEKLKASENQGLMTRQELEMRVLKTTREAIARRPGLAQELTAHAEQMLNLSGIRQVADFEENLARQEAQQLANQHKLVVSEALKRGLPVDILNPDIPKLNIQLQEHAREEQAFKQAQSVLKQKELMDQEAINEFIRTEGVPAIRGSFNEFVQNATPLFNDIQSEGDLSKGITKARNLADQYLANQAQLLLEAGVQGTEAKRLQDLGKRMIDGWMDNIQRHATGANVADVTKNAFNIASNTNKLDMEVRYNPAEVGLLTQVMGHLGTVFTDKPEIQQYLINMVGDLTQGRVGGQAMKEGANRDDIKKGVPDLISVLMGGMKNHVPRDGETLPPGVEKDPSHFETMAVEFEDQLVNNPHGLSSEERFKLLKGLVGEFGSREAGPFFNNATSETKRAFTNMYDQYRIVLANQRDKIKRDVENAGLPFATKVMPDGRVQFQVGNGTESSPGDLARIREFNNRLNNGVGNRLNELIQASSVLFGNSFKEASELVRGDFSKVGGGGIRANVGSPDLLEKIIQVESGGNADAEASTSNAVGVAQFIPSTWNRMIEKHAPELKQGRTPEEVLELRRDEKVSRRMAAALAEDNARVLRDSGIPETDSNIYLAHFLGAGTAVNLLQESGSTPVEEVIGAAAIKANPNVLRGKTVKEVQEWAKRKMGEGT